VVTLLLALDIVVAWMVIQGAHTHLGMVWHGLAGESLAPGAVETHGRQFLVLRRVQIATWIGTAAAFLVWLRRVRGTARALGAPEPGLIRSGALGAFVLPGLTVGAALGHGLAAGLAADPLRPLDLGGPMQLLVLAELLEIAAAAVAILLIRRVTGRLEDLRRAPP
jgi:hypothetical protein